LFRIKRNISENRHIKSRHFDGLVNFFPEINKDKLANIEEFHSSVARLLRTELRETERELEEHLSKITQELSVIDSKMERTLDSVDEPTQIVDRIYELSTSLTNAREENEHYENEVELRNSIKFLKENLSGEKTKVVSLLQNTINDGLRRIVTSVFGPERKSPEININD